MKMLFPVLVVSVALAASVSGENCQAQVMKCMGKASHEAREALRAADSAEERKV